MVAPSRSPAYVSRGDAPPSVRSAAYTLVRHPGHARPTVRTVATAVAVSLPASLLLRAESWLPLHLATGLCASGPPALASRIDWKPGVWSPTMLRAAKLDALVALVAAVIAACPLWRSSLRHLTGRRRTLAVRLRWGRVPVPAPAGAPSKGRPAPGGRRRGGWNRRWSGCRGASRPVPCPRPSRRRVPPPPLAALLAGLPTGTLVAGYGLTGPAVTLGGSGRAGSVVEGLSRPLTPARWERGRTGCPPRCLVHRERSAAPGDVGATRTADVTPGAARSWTAERRSWISRRSSAPSRARKGDRRLVRRRPRP